MTKDYDILAIGNALVDTLAYVDDNFITEHGMVKNTMQLIDEATMVRLHQALPVNASRSGGSAANTAAGIAAFGGSAAFIGTVRNDRLGETFINDLKEIGVDFLSTPKSEGEATGHCIVNVTPDAHRTMNTFLGTAPLISEDDIDEEAIKNCKVLYLEGYLWDQEQTKSALRKAMDIAKEYGKEIAFSLSDPFCVERHRDQFKELLEDYITILFANEDEIKSLFLVEEIHQAIPELRKYCPIGLLTRSEHGAILVTEEEIYEHPAERDLHVKDTTGAGDLFASGFLFGYTHGYELENCVDLATLAASEVIQHIGARPERDLKELLNYLEDKAQAAN